MQEPKKITAGTEMTLKLITVENGGLYPGCFSKKEEIIIQNAIKGRVLHLFSGNSSIGHIRVDFANENATNHENVFDFLNAVNSNEIYDTIILDPPYNERYAKLYEKHAKKQTDQFVIFADTKRTTLLFDYIKKLNPNIIIMKSWYYYILSGYKLKDGYVMYAGGFRRPTFLLIMEKEVHEK